MYITFFLNSSLFRESYLAALGLCCCVCFPQLWRTGASLQSWGTSSSLCWLLLLQSTGLGARPLAVVAGPRRSASSGCGLPALQHRPGSGGTWALLLPSMRDRPRPRIRTMSPATAGRFFTTESPGKPYILGFNMLCFQACKSLNCYCRLVTKLGSTLCNPVGCSTPGPTPQCLLKFMSIESVMLSNHLILCWPLLLLPSVFLSIFSNESALHIRWPKYWSLSFSISPSNTIQG